MPQQIIAAVMGAESGGDNNAVSRVGARGKMQLMPGTAKQMGVDPNDPDQNVLGGARYLGLMLRQFGGNLELALAAYNWGPGNVQQWLSGKASPPAETQAYVRNVMGRLSYGR